MAMGRQQQNKVIGLLLLGLCTQMANAGDLEQAKRIHQRLTGTSGSLATLQTMQSQIDTDKDGINAAMTAMEDPAFYNVTLKNFATPWTNEAQDVFAPLNDYTATVIGMVRDDKDFRTLLSADITYSAANTANVPAITANNNDHYIYLEENGIDLKAALIEGQQSQVTGLPAEATAGVMTSRAAARAFFIDGTNRAMFRFTLMNHLCRDLEQVKDVTLVPDRIRQDVSRSPGGDSRIFLNSCIGCHTGMDPMAQSFAYYNFEYDADAVNGADAGQLVYNAIGQLDESTGTRVQKKYHINANNFKFGFQTPDDKWDNYWREGQNKLLGWDESLTGSGQGASSMGQELAHSEAFAQCQVTKVFKNVCLRSPTDSTDHTQIASMVSSFKSSDYKLKQVFAESADYCKGP